MSNVIEDIKRNFNTGNALTKLIYINVGVFLLFQILFVFSFLFSIAALLNPQFLHAFFFIHFAIRLFALDEIEEHLF